MADSRPARAGSIDPDHPTSSASKEDISASTSHVAPTSTSTKRDRSVPAPHNGRASILSKPSSGAQSLNVSRSPSLVASPRSSRDSSPAGPSFRHPSSSTATSNASKGMRSRKNSHEVSPQRQSTAPSTVLSAAAIQRALSRDQVPPLQPSITSDPTSRILRTSRSGSNAESKDVPSWPISPRLKSPPPSTSARRSSSRGSRNPTDGASTTESTTPKPSDQENEPPHSSEPLQQRISSGRNPVTNVSLLETVQEASTPGTGTESASGKTEEKKHEYFSFTSDEERPLTALHDSEGSFTSQKTKLSGSTKSSPKKASNPDSRIDPDLTPKAKIGTKIHVNDMDVKSPSEPSVRNMIVETETVNSVPQGTLEPPNRPSGRNDPGVVIRVKASNETIRPKKERKKATKKSASGAAASSSSRADIFEDRVKNAMDEVTSDDSDETFVYESNPVEHQPRRSRNHSRTPSVTSLSSVPDRGNFMRSIVNAIDQRVVPKARSMKFASNTSNYGTTDEDYENGNGTIRARDRNGSNNLFRGQRNATGQTLQPEEDGSGFPLSKTKSLTAVGGRGSYAARLAAQNLRHTSSVKRNDNGYASLDLEAEGADDERTPLISAIRSPRNGRSSRRQYRYIDLRSTPPAHRRSCFSRFAGCLLILITIGLLSFGVVCFLFAMSKPLTEVCIAEIKSVIASEQELMMDVVVRAVNPNLVPIAITDLDINLFARSKYVGSEKWWREHGPQPSKPSSTPAPSTSLSSFTTKHNTTHRRLTRSNIIITNPPPEHEAPTTGQTMLLGHILHFDNPLSFDGSFWRRAPQISTGSLRLSQPGNHTEAGGTERWERVLKHDFDLVLRGVLTYGMPLSRKEVNVPVSGEVPVEGNGGGGDERDGGGDGEW